MNLIKPDIKQCQAEIITTPGFMQLGGTRTRERCGNVPIYLAEEVNPGMDGKKGSMSLCEKCKEALITKLGEDICTFTTIDVPLEQRALSLYKPPFKFDVRSGYIFDSTGRTFADSESDNMLLRIRGWGRICTMEEAEKLQDTVGELFVKALNEYWEKNK